MAGPVVVVIYSTDPMTLDSKAASPLATKHKVVAYAENSRSWDLLRKMLSAAFLTGTLLGPLTIAGNAQQSTPDLGNLSLDSLASMEITSVSRKQQTLTEAAGAILVITSKDIRRSGMSNIAELLRTVPGLMWRRSMPTNGPSPPVASASGTRIRPSSCWMAAPFIPRSPRASLGTCRRRC
jgi:hypothetical protein